MKKIQMIIMMLFVFASVKGIDYDICEKNKEGIPIYYKILNAKGKTCEVVKVDFSQVRVQLPGGAFCVDSLCIPETANYDGVELKVESIGSNVIPNREKGDDDKEHSLYVNKICLPSNCRIIKERAIYCYNDTLIMAENSVETVEESNSFGKSYLFIPQSIKKWRGETINSNHYKKIVVNDYAFLFCVDYKNNYSRTPLSECDSLFVRDKNVKDIIVPKSANSSSVLFKGCKWLRSIEILGDITISDYAFSGCSELTSVKFYGENVVLGNGVFGNCPKLKTVILPESLQSIGFDCFRGCKELEEIVLPSKLTTLDYRAFCGCTKLKRIIIPDGVKKIGERCFRYCSELTEVTLPIDLNDIGEYAFESCYALQSIVIPNNVNIIRENAFGNCISIKSLEIPNSVKTILNYAFNGMSNLSSLTIGSSVNRIKEGAFYYCNNLKEITSFIKEPSEIDPNAFSGTTKMKVPLHVPAGTKSLYENTAGWDFMKIDDGLNCKTLTVKVSEGGNVKYANSSVANGTHTFNVVEGNSVTLTLNADKYYYLVSLTRNGVDVTADVTGNTYVLGELTGDVEIVATFSNEGNAETVVLSTSLQTYCPKRDLRIDEESGLKAYIASGFKPSSQEVLLTPVVEVPAGTGILLKGTAQQTYMLPTIATDFVYNNMLVGVTENKTISKGYVLRKGMFEEVTGSKDLSAGTAYLQLPTGTQGAKQIALHFVDSDQTGIEQVENDEFDALPWYTLQGVCLKGKPNRRGIYLHGGRKVLVK